jgi:hypothetical protein
MENHKISERALRLVSVFYVLAALAVLGGCGPASTAEPAAVTPTKTEEKNAVGEFRSGQEVMAFNCLISVPAETRIRGSMKVFDQRTDPTGIDNIRAVVPRGKVLDVNGAIIAGRTGPNDQAGWGRWLAFLLNDDPAFVADTNMTDIRMEEGCSPEQYTFVKQSVGSYFVSDSEGNVVALGSSQFRDVQPSQ